MHLARYILIKSTMATQSSSIPKFDPLDPISVVRASLARIGAMSEHEQAMTFVDAGILTKNGRIHSHYSDIFKNDPGKSSILAKKPKQKKTA